MKKYLTFALLIAAVAFTGCNSNAKTDKNMQNTEPIAYRSLELETIDGGTARLSDWEGKAVMIVNVASKCGFTPQYEGLQALYEKYGEDGLVVVGFPANNFMGQEPGTDEEIKEFCTTNYGVTFPMMSKISVKGDDQHPLYTYLTQQSPYPGKITWNFNKFLLDKDGNVVARFDTKTKPMADDVVKKVEETLKG
jgi:glutathione peroxidase